MVRFNGFLPGWFFFNGLFCKGGLFTTFFGPFISWLLHELLWLLVGMSDAYLLQSDWEGLEYFRGSLCVWKIFLEAFMRPNRSRNWGGYLNKSLHLWSFPPGFLSSHLWTCSKGKKVNKIVFFYFFYNFYRSLKQVETGSIVGRWAGI